MKTRHSSASWNLSSFLPSSPPGKESEMPASAGMTVHRMLEMAAKNSGRNHRGGLSLG
jgi:hypothetical protein